MNRTRVAVGARQRLWLLLGVVAVALSLLAMHQLSSNHTAADPAATVDATTAHLSSAFFHVDGHQPGTGGSDHAHLTASTGDVHPASEAGGCPGCADHSAMALTCLAALVLLVAGWVLTCPVAWRGLRLRRLLPLVLTERRSWLPWPRSLAELSVSRT